MPNPYSPSDSLSDAEAESSVRRRPMIGLCIGSLFLIGCTLSSFNIVYLYIRYPGLTDPTSRPFDYWPQIEVEISIILAVAAGVIGVPTFLLSRNALRLRP